MSDRPDPVARPLPTDPDELRVWALDAAQEVLALRDRSVGDRAALEQAERERDELRAELDAVRADSPEGRDLDYRRLLAERAEREWLTAEVERLNGQLAAIFAAPLWRFGRRLRSPMRAIRLWR